MRLHLHANIRGGGAEGQLTRKRLAGFPASRAEFCARGTAPKLCSFTTRPFAEFDLKSLLVRLRSLTSEPVILETA